MINSDNIITTNNYIQILPYETMKLHRPKDEIFCYLCLNLEGYSIVWTPNSVVSDPEEEFHVQDKTNSGFSVRRRERCLGEAIQGVHCCLLC